MADDDTIRRLADDVRRHALGRGLTVAVAESLTGGALSQSLARARDAGDWFAGGVVAYRDATKQRVLGVPEGPVITPECARAMALGVLAATGADVAVATTGAGGPGEEEGHAPGTVFISVAAAHDARDFAHLFDGDPAEVVTLSVEHALRHLSGHLLSTR